MQPKSTTTWIRCLTRVSTGWVVLLSLSGSVSFTWARDSFEPDDTAGQANALNINCNLVHAGQFHEIDPLGDVDYIKFTAQAGKTYVIEAFNVSSGLDLVIVLYDRDGITRLTSADGNGNAQVRSRIIWTCPISGTYFLKAYDYASVTNPSEVGNYYLRILHEIDFDNPDEGYTCWDENSEPDDITRQSRQVAVNCQTVFQPLNRSIDPYGDMDTFWFRAQQDHTYMIEALNVSAGVDLTLVLYDRNRSTVLADAQGNGNANVHSRIVWTCPISGTYFLKAYDYASVTNPSEVGIYDIRILPDSNERECRDEEDEPNEISQYAVPIERGTTYGYDINPLGDRDYFVFEAIAGKEYFIEVLNPIGIDPEVSLYDRNGTTRLGHGDNNGTGNVFSQIRWTCPISGRYYLLVQDDSHNNTGAYQVRVRDGSAASPCDCPDIDGDGVVDAWDRCPDTPRGHLVNLHGCPVSQLPVAQWPWILLLFMLVVLGKGIRRAKGPAFGVSQWPHQPS